MIFQKIYKAVTGEDFKQCLIELKAATASAGIESPVYIPSLSVLDNACIHHYCGLQKTINQALISVTFLCILLF